LLPDNIIQLETRHFIKCDLGFALINGFLLFLACLTGWPIEKIKRGIDMETGTTEAPIAFDFQIGGNTALNPHFAFGVRQHFRYAFRLQRCLLRRSGICKIEPTRRPDLRKRKLADFQLFDIQQHGS